MRGKRGQFYLVAAIIIIAILIGFVVISNYSKKRSSTKIYDFGEELGIEAENVLDHGTYQEKDAEELNELLTEFTVDYASYAEEGTSLYFIFGNEDKIIVIGYQELATEEVSITIGGVDYDLPSDGESLEILNPLGSEIIITIEEDEYEFQLKTGENFYFVVSQEIGDEKYVVTN